jgi:hypothetical protein
MTGVVELLTQIAENTKPDNQAVWVAAISSASALLGAGIGALLLYKGTSRQIESQKETEEKKLRVTIVTTERLRWLQEIRSRSSEFYANLDMNYSLLKRPINPQQNPEFQKQADEIAQKVMVQCNQIILLLNPAKPQQDKLRNACNGALEFFQSCVAGRNTNQFNFDDARYASIKTDFFNALTEIGVETWGKIKGLK